MGTFRTKDDEAIVDNAIDEARGAAGRGDWAAAFALLVAADAETALSASDLPLLAEAAYAAGDLDVTIDTWERAHAAYAAQGDRQAAAGAAVRAALHLLIDTGLLASVRGWAARAERLLQDGDECGVHAWLAVVRTYERFLNGDFEAARQCAARATELGRRHGEPAAAILGQVADARSRIFAGEVEAGFLLLDEVAVVALSGALDPLSIGVIYCELLCACQGLAQYDRAAEWTDAMERWRRAHGLGSFGGRCRVHRAELLRVRGESVEAEREALRSVEELRPYLRMEFGWPLTELGLIRLRTGDLDGAERAFLEAHENGWDPQPGLALVRLARGDIDAAVSLIRGALDEPRAVPSKELPPNTALRRAPLLDAQVEIALEAGDIEGARAAADELTQIAGTFESTALRAAATVARGRVLLSTGELDDGMRALVDGVRLWISVGAPYETANARVLLAELLRARGNIEGAAIESRAARTTFERIGAADRAARAATASDEATPPRPTPAAADPARSIFAREAEIWHLTFAGHTARVRDLTGMHYLARLLHEPGREFHVLDLVGDRAVGSGSHPAHAGEVLDAQAKRAYRRRLDEIGADIEEAARNSDDHRAARAAAERDFIVRELARAVGLSGRDRRAGDASERARASVTRAVRHAMHKITAAHPDLGAHLTSTIRTGTYCSYVPDPRIPPRWEI